MRKRAEESSAKRCSPACAALLLLLLSLDYGSRQASRKGAAACADAAAVCLSVVPGLGNVSGDPEQEQREKEKRGEQERKRVEHDDCKRRQ